LKVIIRRNEITIEGIATHITAELLTKQLSELLETRERRIAFFYEGGPGPLNRGMVIKVRLSKKLGDSDLVAVKKFFEVRGIPAKVVTQSPSLQD